MGSLLRYTSHHNRRSLQFSLFSFSNELTRILRLCSAQVFSNLLFYMCLLVFIRGFFCSAIAAEINTVQEKFRTGKYTECLEASRKAIDDGAYSAEWRVLMIKSLMAMGQYDKAADDMDIVLLHYPVSMPLLELAHTVYLHNNQPDRADEAIRRLVRVGTSRDLRFMSPDDLVALGKSLLLLGQEPRLVLDELFTRAIKNDPNCLDAYLAAGDLALSKQDYELAADQYRSALKRFGDEPDVHLGLAKAFYESDRNQMIQSLGAALYINPNHVPSLLLLAEHKIDCEDYDGADELLDRAIAVNPWNPEAWAYRAVLAHLASDSEAVKSDREKALKFWPTNPRVDYLIGRKLSQKYRFAEGSAFQRRALGYDPNYLPAKIQLAQDLLRLGDEKEGWKLADEVHAGDAYNIEAYNLGNLHDHLSKFVTLHADGFVVRMDKHEADVYGGTVIDLLEEAKAKLCEKYSAQIDKPVVVELFDNQQDFAVRTFGMPGGEGYLGVCFGNVITANSPKAQNPSCWKAMLWHEFCHVVTLNLTENKMPRWLSEGISVYEEGQRDPTWGQRMNPEYRGMVLDGKLTPISKLSAAFLSPPTPSYLQFAYYESALVVEFIVKQYGLDSLKAILADLAKGGQINVVISAHAAPVEDIEKQFETFARKRAENLAPEADFEQPERGQLDPTDPAALAEWLKGHPNNFWALTQYAKALIANRQWAEAKEPLEKLIALYRQYSGEDNAYRLLAEAHRQLGETQQEQDVLGKLAMISSDASYAYERLIEIAAEKKDWQQVVKYGEKAMAVYPMLAQLHWQLGRANEELGRNEQAIESYQRLLLLDPADPAEVHYRLGRLLLAKDPAAAKRHVLLALAEAPRFRAGHRLLLKIINETQGQAAPESGGQVSISQKNSETNAHQNEMPAAQEDAK
jgi:tetratricopeptide (TPR) repeat protein